MTGAGALDVSVIVPVRNESPHLGAAMGRILAQRFDGQLEFLFVDGDSTDGSRQILTEAAAADPRVVVLDNPALRTPQALNIGLRAARGRYVARMDAHALYPADYLALGVRRLARGDVASVSGPAIAVGEGVWSRRVALALSTRLGVGGARFRLPRPQEEEVASGFTGLWRRDTLLALGGWDEHALGDEDTELAARLRAGAGRIVCLPQLAAAYSPRDSLRGLAVQYLAYGRARVRTSHRHPASLRASQLLPAGLTVALAAACCTRDPRLQLPARAGLALYAGAVTWVTAAAARRAGLREAAGLPAVFAVMHVSYGAGFLAACARSGPPARAIAAATGRLLRGEW